MIQQLQCEFAQISWCKRNPKYTCAIKGRAINENVELEFVGDHKDGMSNMDVDAITFMRCDTKRLPQGLVDKFPNLKYLEFSYSNLNFIERNDLKDYTQLVDLYLHGNKIAFLPKDLFDGMKKLEVLWVYGNPLDLIEPGIFENLHHLTNVQICDDATFDSAKGSLDDVKRFIEQKYVSSPWKKVIDMKIKSAIVDDLQLAMSNENLKDFTVTVGSEEFRAHKFVLAARSAVLAGMIENNKDAECLNLVDISPEIFQTIFRYIYTDALPELDVAKLIQIVMAAEKLQMKKLTIDAARMLNAMINSENAFKILALANKHGLTDLERKSFAIIKNYFGMEEIDQDLASQPEKLKKLVEMRKKMVQMQAEFDALLKKK